jgi:hypothetical protein
VIMGSDERVLGGVVSGTVEDVHTPVFEDAQLFCEETGHEPPESKDRYWGAICQK